MFQAILHLADHPMWKTRIDKVLRKQFRRYRRWHLYRGNRRYYDDIFPTLLLTLFRFVNLFTRTATRLTPWCAWPALVAALPLVDGQGSQLAEAMTLAAMRYTESQLTPLAMGMLRNRRSVILRRPVQVPTVLQPILRFCGQRVRAASPGQHSKQYRHWQLVRLAGAVFWAALEITERRRRRPWPRSWGGLRPDCKPPD